MKWREVDKPIRVSGHCRHYDYLIEEHGGPRCAVGCDLQAGGASRKCMPGAAPECEKREEYTDVEREAWAAYYEQSVARMAISIASITEPVPCYGRKQFPCQCDDAGTVSVQRGSATIYGSCSCGACEWRANIGHNDEWPPKQDQAGGVK